MKPLIFLMSLFVFLLAACQIPDKKPVGLAEGIYAYSQNGTPAEQQTALLLLTHIALDEPLESAIAADLASGKDPTKSLLLSHLLYVRTQETKYGKQFIKEYPAGSGLEELYVAMRNTDYITASNPLQNTLAQLAATDDRALAKLVGALAIADGADAAALDEQLTALYQLQPERIQKAFDDLNMDIGQVEGIVNLKNTEK
jgi:hypothetical protein